MILVTDMKVVNTHRDIHWLTHDEQRSWINAPLGVKFDPESVCEIKITKEMVRGKRFRNSLGLDVVIGWDEQTQKLLGLPFQVFDAQEKRRESDYRENTKLRKRLREWEEMTAWQLIKRAITIAFTR